MTDVRFLLADFIGRQNRPTVSIPFSNYTVT